LLHPFPEKNDFAFLRVYLRNKRVIAYNTTAQNSDQKFFGMFVCRK
jgi:hypothetical protein